MIIYENEITKDNGESVVRIDFTKNKRCYYTAEVPAKFENCQSLKAARARLKVVREFLKEYPKFTEKEVLKGYAKINPYFADFYKEKYPRGGRRKGSGRPEGTKRNTASKTYFTKYVTGEEKEFLENCFKWFQYVKENEPGTLEQLTKLWKIYGVERLQQIQSSKIKGEIRTVERIKPVKIPEPAEYQKLIKGFSWGE